MQDNAQKYIAKYVADLHALVSHGQPPASGQEGDALAKDHPEAAQLVAELARTLETHEQLLGARLEALGNSPTNGVQDVAATVTGAVAGLYNKLRSEAIAKSVRDDYTFVSHCSVSWLMLLTTARGLGDHDTEELAEQGYRDCARLIMSIDRLMPKLVADELRQDGFTVQLDPQWAARIVSDAWDRAQVAA